MARDLTMDALIEAPAEKPKHTRTQRYQRRIAYLNGDIAALEKLVGKLLGHMESMIDPTVTDKDRVRFRVMIDDIRDTLAEGERKRLKETSKLCHIMFAHERLRIWNHDNFQRTVAARNHLLGEVDETLSIGSFVHGLHFATTQMGVHADPVPN